MLTDEEFRQICRDGSHPDANTSAAAWGKITELGAASYEYIIRCMEVGDDKQRLVAAKAFAIFQNKRIFYRPEGASVLLGYLETESNAEVRLWYIHGVAGLLYIDHFPEIENRLLSYMFDEDFNIREHVCRAMAYIHSKAALPYMIHLLDDEHRQVATAAREALRLIDTDEARLVLQAWRKRTGRDIEGNEDV